MRVLQFFILLNCVVFMSDVLAMQEADSSAVSSIGYLISCVTNPVRRGVGFLQRVRESGNPGDSDDHYTLSNCTGASFTCDVVLDPRAIVTAVRALITVSRCVRDHQFKAKMDDAHLDWLQKLLPSAESEQLPTFMREYCDIWHDEAFRQSNAAEPRCYNFMRKLDCILDYNKRITVPRECLDWLSKGAEIDRDAQGSIYNEWLTLHQNPEEIGYTLNNSSPSYSLEHPFYYFRKLTDHDRALHESGDRRIVIEFVPEKGPQ